MAGFIVWLIIIITVVAINKKSIRVKKSAKPNVPPMQQPSAAGGVQGAAAGGRRERAKAHQSVPSRKKEPVALSRAKAPVEEDFKESADMEAVFDLMVKGPDLELTFERDFIAEGVEMLNRIQA